MAVPTQLSDLSATAASNSPAGTDTVGTTMDDFIRAHASIIARISAGTDALSTPVLGNATATSVLANSAAKSGYTTGAGGTVTQLTSKTTAVTINKPCGTIVTTADSIDANSQASFVVNNSLVAATDVIVLNYASGGSGTYYDISTRLISAGRFDVTVWNRNSSPLAEAITINFAVIKSVAA